MEIEELACQLTTKIISKITLHTYPYEAGKQVRDIYDTIVKWITENECPVSDIALRMTLALLDKREVLLPTGDFAIRVAEAYGACATKPEK